MEDDFIYVERFLTYLAFKWIIKGIVSNISYELRCLQELRRPPPSSWMRQKVCRNLFSLSQQGERNLLLWMKSPWLGHLTQGVHQSHGVKATRKTMAWCRFGFALVTNEYVHELTLMVTQLAFEQNDTISSWSSNQWARGLDSLYLGLRQIWSVPTTSWYFSKLYEMWALDCDQRNVKWSYLSLWRQLLKVTQILVAQLQLSDSAGV